MAPLLIVTLDNAPTLEGVWPPGVVGMAMVKFLLARRFCICWMVRMVGPFSIPLGADSLPLLPSEGVAPGNTGITQFPILIV